MFIYQYLHTTLAFKTGKSIKFEKNILRLRKLNLLQMNQYFAKTMLTR